jgi:hypothetical protein
MSDAARRVRQAARDASSTDDRVRDAWEVAWDEHDMAHPLDEETLDERASTQMGPPVQARRDAHD